MPFLSDLLPTPGRMMIAAGSVAKRQKRFLWLLEPIETRPRLPVQRLIMFDGVGHRVKSVTKVDFLAPRLVG